MDLVLWSGELAPTLCIMSCAVHHCPCVFYTVPRCGTCGGCHCLRVSADTPLTALHRASVPPSQDYDLIWLCVCVCVYALPTFVFHGLMTLLR